MYKLLKKIEMAADMLTWGRLEKCEKCGGQFQLGKNNYVCNGNISEWAKCMSSVTEPSRVKVRIPKELKEKYNFLKNYKCHVSNRIFHFTLPSSSSMLKKEEHEG